MSKCQADCARGRVGEWRSGAEGEGKQDVCLNGWREGSEGQEEALKTQKCQQH